MSKFPLLALLVVFSVSANESPPTSPVPTPMGSLIWGGCMKTGGVYHTTLLKPVSGISVQQLKGWDTHKKQCCV